MEIDVEGYAIEMEQRIWAAAFAQAAARRNLRGGSPNLQAINAREAAEEADRVLELYRIAEDQ